VLACGELGEWNDHLIAETAEELRSVTDHALIGPAVGPDNDRDDLYHALMGYAEELDRRYAALDAKMRAAGVDDPHLAITELQLFPNYADDLEDEPSLPAAWRFSRGMPRSLAFPTKKTISEALYHATVVHECVRMGEFPEAITHSAAVNHGGGLRKERESVWADPCYYGRTVATELAEGCPVAIDVECGMISTDRSFGQIDPVDGVPALDAVAVVDGGELVVSLVHRSSEAGPIDVALDLAQTPAADVAERVELSADTMAAGNTFENPENVAPTASTVDVADGAASFTVPPYSLTRLAIPLETA
jgi:alpha-N-arabinofuranosidase